MLLSWQRWLILITLAVVGLGPGLAWSPQSPRPGAAFALDWSAALLPQQITESKSKFSALILGLVALCVTGVSSSRRSLLRIPVSPYTPPIKRQRLYLIYVRIQSDGG